MSRITPARIEGKFNQACSSLDRAIRAFQAEDIVGYETSVRSAATEAGEALEWSLKSYLRGLPAGIFLPDELATLQRHPSFHDLMTLMQKYASPPIDPLLVKELYFFRDFLRNPGTHDASVPNINDVHRSVQACYEIISTYIPHIKGNLAAVPTVPSRSSLDGLRGQYLDVMRASYEFLDLGGISPRVGNRIVKVRMKELYTPLLAIEEAQLFESFTDQSLEADGEPSQHNIPDADDLEDILPTISTNGERLSWILSKQAGAIAARGVARRPVSVPHILGHPRVVILGDPGSGKTTVARYIAYSLATESLEVPGAQLSEHIPIVIRATDFAATLADEGGLTFYEYVVQRSFVRFGKLFDWHVRLGRCLLIVDGIDEIADRRIHSLALARIERFVSEFYDNRFIVTSRVVGYRQNRISEDFVHVAVSELNRQQQQQFLT